ncbi:MAG: hypothetical protein NVS9B12_04770 [Vulcanimicrobiaceae bacterium]
MLPPDLALAQYFNATTQAYISQAPAYMTYRERTHINASGPLIKSEREIDRTIMLRQRDNYAVMQDLPGGGTTFGQAFPIIPYFDPLSNFVFGYYGNLKALNRTLTRQDPGYLPLPAADAGVDSMLYYLSFWAPSYLPGSTESAPRFTVQLVKPVDKAPYPAEIDIDPTTKLPGHIEIKFVNDNIDVKLDYSIVQGHWMIAHGLVTSVVGPFRGTSETTFDQFTFPATAPDPRL